jgi:hypothetical protein
VSSESALKFVCTERAVYGFQVADDGRSRRVAAPAPDRQAVQLTITPTGGAAGIRQVHIRQVLGQIDRSLEGSMVVGQAVDAEQGHWHFDLRRRVLRQVEPMEGQAARFRVARCRPH